MTNVSTIRNLVTMTGQVNMYLCLVVLCGIVHAFPTEDTLDRDPTFEESNTFTKNIKELFNTILQLDNNVTETGVTPTFTAELSNTPTTDETKVQRPVNELYPHAVLYGGTCGGTIISPTWIITAAHCSIGSSGRYVLAGTNNTKDGSGIIVRVKRRVVHPRFLVGPYWLDAREYNLKQVRARFDYLLVELDKPLPLDGVIMKAAKLNRTYKLVPKTNVSFAGFGADYHGGYMKRDMHARKFELLTVNECARIGGYSRVDMICAKGIPPDYDFACNGDSGSGLVDENGVLIGIASWVEDDAIECRNGAVVYFAKIGAVRRWIHEVTKI